MIGELQRVRPNFREQDLLLQDKTGELSYLPTEFAPHTISASITGRDLCEYTFEYQIDEDAASDKLLSAGISVTFGKYTGKILKITLSFVSLEDLISKTQIVYKILENRKFTIGKESYRKHYDLIIKILQSLENDLLTDSEVQELVKKSC